MPKYIYSVVNDCWGCPYKGQTGEFSNMKQGIRSCCNHIETCKQKGHNDCERIIANPNFIPDWCPL